MIPIEKMIQEQMIARDITDPAVINAMREVDRADFVPLEFKSYAYYDRPLPIGKGQTISQPYMVAYMAQLLELRPHEKLLEIGTGCGYSAAVMSRMVSHVYSIEIIEWLVGLARDNLKTAHIENVSTRFGDGNKGWPEEAPFDKIVLTAATPEIPKPLKQQLKIGGRILAPIGKRNQQILMVRKTGEDRFKESKHIQVRFVPLTGDKNVQ